MTDVAHKMRGRKSTPHRANGRGPATGGMVLMRAQRSDIPAGLCQCGCGKTTTIIRKTEKSKGRIAGQPSRFIKGHHAALFPKPTDYIVDPDTGCWVWQRQKDTNGYGRLRLNGRAGGMTAAHRHYFESNVGPIPDGLEIDHLCRNRACVNPSHLEPVTKRENILRGGGTGAMNARKTHCVHGHEFTPENTDITIRGHRRCRICRRERG